MSAPQCPLCWKAEASRFERMAAIVLSWLEPRPHPAQAIMAGMAGTMRAALGATDPTWYEKHRKAWEDTGDPIELERMTRHVPAA